MRVVQMTEHEQRMYDDLVWAQAAPEVQQHHGKLVAVRGKKVLAVGGDRASLLSSAVAVGGGSEDDVVVVVVMPETPWEFPSE